VLGKRWALGSDAPVFVPVERSFAEHRLVRVPDPDERLVCFEGSLGCDNDAERTGRGKIHGDVIPTVFSVLAAVKPYAVALVVSST
jgi:hypothetical protein